MTQKKSPILVSGSHRSGSTWLGKMIALSKDVGYIQEPFHLKYGISENLFRNWFTYICEENEKKYYEAIEQYLSFRYPFLKKIDEADTMRDYGRAVRDNAVFFWHRINRRRPIMKDPISIFSVEWLQKTFNMDVVILMRHPAAFVGSIKKVDWRTGMNHFLEQPLLMRDLLESFEPKMKAYIESDKDIIDEAILIWNMIHSVILKYQKEHSEWLFIRHEDLSKKPLKKFEMIYDYLNLEYTDAIRDKIKRFTTEDESPSKIKRDSKSNVWSWKKRLTAEEIRRVKNGTEDIASQLYSDEDW